MRGVQEIRGTQTHDDVTSFAASRANMINGQVIPAGITDRRLIAALAHVPREHFVPAHMASFAYADTSILLKEARSPSPARYLMSVGPFARLVQEAAIDQKAVVLDVGCTTGYSAAVLARISKEVIALECDPELAAVATTTLASMNLGNVTVITGPLGEGWPSGAPYDAILLEGSIETAPSALVEQLSVYGRLAAVIGRGLSAHATIFTKTRSASGSRRAFNAAIPALPGFAMPKTFVF